jgi:hypothetical protein
MHRLGVNVLELLAAHQWDSKESQEAYKRIARKIPGLDGILVIQYYPYNGGYGGVLWGKNQEGETIPVISARYSLWAHAKVLKKHGPPAFIASEINSAAHEGAVTSPEFMDWTIVHAWSSFKKADTTRDLWAEEVNESDEAEKSKAVGGYEPVRWAAAKLAPHVRVVSPAELIWRMRLYLKTRETLDALDQRSLRTTGLPSATAAQLTEYRSWLRRAPLNTDDQRREAFDQLKAIVSR